MKIIKKANGEVLRENAHGGSGGRKLFVDDDEIQNFQGMTYGYLPAGNKFEWHSHENVNEVMLVLHGKGFVRDDEGEYNYADGDFFILPAGIVHEIENASDFENEMIFVRVKI